MAQKRKLNSNNSSGHCGVSWNDEKGRWHSKIGKGYRRIHLGYFYDFEDAVAAYEKERRHLGLPPREHKHGKGH